MSQINYPASLHRRVSGCRLRKNKKMKDRISIIAAVLAVVAIAASVSAANPAGTNAGVQVQQQTQTANQGESGQSMNQDSVRVQAGTVAGPEGAEVQAGAGVQTQQQVQNSGQDSQIKTQDNAQIQSGASGQNGAGDRDRVQQQDQIQQRLQDGTGANGQNPAQDRNQTREGEQIQEQAADQETSGQAPEADREENAGQGKGDEISSQRRSRVAAAVQQMLQIADRNEGIGQQVRIIAQNQNQNQEKLEADLLKIQNRSGFAKFVIGPNYGEINNARKVLEQNREQIQQLNQIRSQITNEGEQQTLSEQIQVLEQANLEISNSLDIFQKGFSLFGWLFRMFAEK